LSHDGAKERIVAQFMTFWNDMNALLVCKGDKPVNFGKASDVWQQTKDPQEAVILIGLGLL
jgi:hypothetical protein